MTPRRRLSLAASFTALCALLIGASPVQPAAAAQHPAPLSVRGDVEDFTFASYEGDFHIARDDDGRATLRTVETLVADFPQDDQNKGIIRAIPESAEGVHLHTRVVSVTDAVGNDVPYTVESDGGFLEVATGTDEYVHGMQSYVIEYTQIDVVRAFDDTTAEEFYWDGPGTGWEQPFQSALMRVHVPSELGDALTGNAACYSGSQGDNGACSVSRADADGELTFTTSTEQLEPEETVTIAVGFENGTFAQPVRPITWPVFTIVPLVLLALGVIILVLVLMARRRSLRDEAGRGTVIAEYSPSDAGLRIDADIIDKSASYVPAALIRLAVSRAARIIDRPEHSSFTLELMNPERIPDEDRELASRLFGGGGAGTRVDLWAENKRFADYISTEPARLRSESEKGGYRQKKRVPHRAALLTSALVLAAGSMVFVIVASQFYAVTAISGIALVACVGVAGASLFLTMSRSARTVRGAVLREYLQGVKLYLTVAEEDRIRMLQSPSRAERVDTADAEAVLVLYEKLLPYAVLWGIAEDWARVLEQRYSESGTGAEWLVADRGLVAGALVARIAAFSAANGSATPWAQSAQSSSGGGSLGGGFAGGGGGGGGGGGR